LDFELIEIGGSILKDREAFNLVNDIVENELAKGILPVNVVTAMKGVTDQLMKH
jgi:aspartokinase